MKKFFLPLIFGLTSSTLLASEFEGIFEGDSLTVYIRDDKNSTNHIYNQRRADRRTVSYSTFKIPNSVIALETGAVDSLAELFRFDAERHSSPVRKDPKYNRDQTLETAFKNSVVWTYQEIAKRVGRERYKYYLEEFDYGNRDASGDIENFWLARLAISAAEQVTFLSRFYSNEFKLKKTTRDTVRNFMLLEDTDSYRLYGKTGTGRPDGEKWSGWLVGFIETKGNVYFFAINADAESYRKLKLRRMQILRKSFNHIGVRIPERR